MGYNRECMVKGGIYKETALWKRGICAIMKIKIVVLYLKIACNMCAKR